MYGKEYISFTQHVGNMYSNEELEQNILILIEKLLVKADYSIK